jgi:Undecaprenyl-phosphate glucose phosphotransferase
MSRRILATATSRATIIDPFAGAQPVGARVPHRMLVDVVALIDVMLVVLAAFAAKLLYISLLFDDPQAQQPYLVAGLAGGLVVHYVMRLHRLHEPAAILAWRDRIGVLLISVGLSFLTLIAMAYLLKISAGYSRGWLLTWLCLSALLLIASRPLLARLQSWLAATGYTARRIAIVGDGAARERMVQTLRDVSGVRIAGVFSDAGDGDLGRNGSVEELIAIGQRNEIDEVAIALSDAPNQDTERLVESLSILPVDVWLCPTAFAMPILATARVGTLSLLQVKLKPIREWGYLIKLAFDYVAGAICLVAFAPLMLAIAVAIKIDSSGPVFFRQRRHGFNHRIIDVFKFRTMIVTENGDRIDQARKNDPRVTRVGRLLRRTSLDELPQLFNVLRGEMSLVGPRPHALAHNQHYQRFDRYASRHCVKPGMTGWAQINGLRGPTEDPEKMLLRVRMDLYYIENWSLWLDLKIIAATPFVGFIHRNAL